MRIVGNICEYCGDTFYGFKKAKGCPKCRRIRANNRTISFLKAHPEYGRQKMKEYRARLKQGILIQPIKSAAIHEAKMIASASKQGWEVEFSHLNGQWGWSASKDGARLVSGKKFKDFREAKQDFLEAVF